MKKLLLVSLCFLCLFVTQIYAQNRTVTGTVTSKDDGLPIPGVSVTVKGTRQGTQTSVSGKFSLPNVPANATLVFSFTGFVTTERPVSGVGAVDVALETSYKELGEVVVTGTLGRKTSEKAVGYNETHLDASAVNQSAETNLLTGLTGKVAGLNVSTTGTGVDAGIRVTLRGERSINGNNQALIVVDGVPLPGGDISAIDPNTIESYDVLNGGSAGVLYGSEASNGVIVITTRKGAAGNKPNVTYSNSIQAAQAAYFPSIQNKFGSNGGENVAQGGVDPLSGLFLIVPFENQLFGPAYNGQTYVLNPHLGNASGPAQTGVYSPVGKNAFQQFYNVGVIEQNVIGVNSGNSDDYFNMSALNVVNHGITPLDASTKYSLAVKAGKRYGIFKAEYNFSYAHTAITQVGGSYFQNRSVPFILSQLPGNLNLKDYQDPNSAIGNPSDFFEAYTTNPYWNVYNARNTNDRNVFQAGINLTLNPTKYLDITYKLTDNFGYNELHNTTAQVNFTPYSVSDPQQVGNVPSGFPTGVIPGTVSDQTQSGDGNGGLGRLQGDLLINLHPTLSKDFKTNLLIGNTWWNQRYKSVFNSASQLLIPGLYNLAYNGGTPGASESTQQINQIAYFADATIGYKDFLFIDGSIRNEQDSRLAAAARSYWYPGVSGSFVFTDAIPALKNNKVISFGKLRAAYSITGQVNIGPYQINNVLGVTGGGFPYGTLGGLSLGTTNYTQLVPERATEVEFGAELGFLDNMIHGSFTYYKQNDRNQTLSVGVSQSTGYSNILTNVGELQSSGFEAVLAVSPLTKAKNKVGLDLSATLTNTESKVISLLPNVPQFNISGGSGNQYAIVGDPYPEIKGTDFQKDPQGHTIINPNTGYPLANQTTTVLGRTSPEWMLGLRAAVNYKFISFDVTAEYRTGYVDYFSNSGTYIFGGNSAFTTQADRQRFIYPNSVYVNSSGGYSPNTSYSTIDGNYRFWQNSTINTTTSPYVTSGAFWKIREANLSFNLNQFVKNNKYIKGLKVSLTGRNLFMWVPKTNFWGDPEVSGDTSNAGSTPVSGNIPGQRVFGAKLDVTL